MRVVEPEDIGADPTLRPTADVGEPTGITLKGKRRPTEQPIHTNSPTERDESARQADVASQHDQDEDHHERLTRLGFRLVNGAYRRRPNGRAR